MAVHEDAQIGAHAGLPRREQVADLAHLLVVELADLHRRLRIEAGEPGFDLLESADVSLDVVPVVPALLQDDGDHGAGQQGVGARPDGEMDVGELRRLGVPGIDDDQQLVRVLGELLQHPGRLGDLVALHAVPARRHQHVRVVDVGVHQDTLAAGSLSHRPEVPGELLAEGVVEVLAPQGSHQRDHEAGLEVAAHPATAHEGQRARAVCVDGGPHLLGDLEDRLIPGDSLELAPHPLQRMQ